jgi:hypothetical protein
MKHLLTTALFACLTLLGPTLIAQSLTQPAGSTTATLASTTNPASGTNSTPAKDEAGTPFTLREMLLIISICGLIGGYANYRRTVEQLRTTVPAPAGETEPVVQPATLDERRRHLLTCLTLGLLASALVPLFLNSLSSNLLENKTDNNLLIFAGFCLLAGVASNGFIDALTQRMLNQIKETQRQVNEAARQVNESRIQMETLQENLREKPE